MDLTQSETQEDPLIAALPPATDYITYLTLLEYQLSPRNLSTLNELLSSDDGTLATEIGWDLLKLVLPLLHQVPIEVKTCLEIISRRGNPREVVVRVAEELEKLGHNLDNESTNDFLENEEDDALPTFPGEAARIHLGKMKLDGMPDAERQQAQAQPGEPQLEPQDETATLQALLSMLSILHPRIKTQYPSRFLATSLPAALGAYRRLTIDTTTTTTFLALLSKLAGKRRPALPSRTPSSIKDPSSTAPLPDPEAASEAEQGTRSPSETERAIINRLLQAVLLELLNDYVSSLQHEEVPAMSWTTRLRERVEPQRLVPGKTTDSDLWHASGDLKERDTLLGTTLAQSKELMLDAREELEKLASSVNDIAPSDNIESEDEPSEYPTSPSQIPFPPSGLVLLAAAEAYYSPRQDYPKLSPDTLHFAAALLDPISLPSSALKDAVMSLIYPNINNLATQMTPEPFKSVVHLLTQTFVTTPEPQIRDDAYYITTKLLHNFPQSSTRLQIIKSAIKCTDEPPSAETGPESESLSIPPHLQPALQAIGVDWLKDEFSSFIHPKRSISQQESSTEAADTKGLDPQILETDPVLRSATIEQSLPTPPEDSSAVLLSLPFHISTLNLLCILLSQRPPSETQVTNHNDDNNTSTTATATTTALPNTTSSEAEIRPSYLPTSLTSSTKTYLTTLESWRDYLVPQLLANPNSNSTTTVNMSGNNDETAAQDDESVLESGDIQAAGADIFALDDACRRMRGLVGNKREKSELGK